MMMAQEEHAQKNSNSSSSSSCGGELGSFKKMKQKKVPQRGLGVAQLEKIRLEEQQKKEAALQQAATSNVLTPNPIKSPSNSSSGLAVQCPTFRPSISSSTSVPPLLPQSATDHLPSLNSMFRPPPPPPPPPPSIPNVEILHPKPVPLSKPLNVSGGEIGWSAPAPPPAPVPASWSKVWNGEYNLEGENQRLDHYGFRYRPNVNMAHESTTPFVPLPNFMQRSSQIQQPSSSSMVNISTGISSSPVMNFQMEPPSNQNIPATNNYPPLWPDEEKMIGMKRPYPFSIETPPAPAFHFKCPSAYVAPPSRLDEAAASCSNRNFVSSNRGFAVIRECPARPNAMSEPSKIELGDRERGGGLSGDFLTLAPPTISSQHLNLKHKQSLANSGLHSRELSEYHHYHPSRQGNTEDAVQGQGPSKPIHQPPFFSFFPSPKKQQQIGQSSTTLANNDNCSNTTDVGENIDLSLKL